MKGKIAKRKSSSVGRADTAEKKYDEELAALAKAIAHPTRIQILRLLARRNACVCGDIVNELPLAQSTVSEHLRILKAAGLIIGEVDGPRICYCIDAGALGRLRRLVRDLRCPDVTCSSSREKDS